MEKLKINLTELLTVGALTLGVIGGGSYLAGSYFMPDTIETRIVGTDTKRNRDTYTDMYLINTADGTFRNQDAWYKLKFDSSDLQGEAKDLIGEDVTLKKYGWRIPMLSMYENVTDISQN